MVARVWKGWTASENADEVTAHLTELALTRWAAGPGHLSATVLSRPVGGGVEVMTLSIWESAAALPAGTDEDHRLLVARETIPACWQVAGSPAAIARAA